MNKTTEAKQENNILTVVWFPRFPEYPIVARLKCCAQNKQALQIGVQLRWTVRWSPLLSRFKQLKESKKNFVGDFQLVSHVGELLTLVKCRRCYYMWAKDVEMEDKDRRSIPQGLGNLTLSRQWQELHTPE